MKLIVDLNNINMASINQKYINKSFVLSKEYRNFKDAVSWNCKAHIKEKEFDILRKFKIAIEFSAYCDVDAPIKPILDGIFRPGIIDADDRQVLELHIIKKPLKRGSLGSLQVYIEEI